MRWFAGAAGLCLALAGCQNGGYLPGRPIAKLTVADVTTAQTIALAGKDAAGAGCWGAWLPVADALAAGQAIGLATGIELYRVAMLGAQGPCAPIVMPILVKLGPLLAVAGALQGLPVVAP